MSTIFTFKATKAEENKDVQYQVDLGQDILRGKTDAEIRELATDAMIVKVQNHKGLIRMSHSAKSAEDTLFEMGYTNARVTTYKPKTKTLSPEDLVKKIIKSGMTKEQVMAIIENLS